MNGGIGRIIIGVLFLVLGSLRLASFRSDGVKALGFIMFLYGLFSIGHGIYKISKGQSGGRLINEKSEEDQDETLDNDI